MIQRTVISIKCNVSVFLDSLTWLTKVTKTIHILNSYTVCTLIFHIILRHTVFWHIHAVFWREQTETYRPQSWGGAWGRGGWSGRSERRSAPDSSLGFCWGCMWKRPCFHPPDKERSLHPLTSAPARVWGCPVSPRCIFLRARHSRSNSWASLQENNGRFKQGHFCICTSMISIYFCS